MSDQNSQFENDFDETATGTPVEPDMTEKEDAAEAVAEETQEAVAEEITEEAASEKSSEAISAEIPRSLAPDTNASRSASRTLAFFLDMARRTTSA